MDQCPSGVIITEKINRLRYFIISVQANTAAAAIAKAISRNFFRF